MAVYQHKCPECEHVAEETAPIEQGPAGLICLPCYVKTGKQIAMRRLFHAAPAIFRGGGWGGS